jgi:hypothetical protein
MGHNKTGGPAALARPGPGNRRLVLMQHDSTAAAIESRSGTAAVHQFEDRGR